MKKSLSFISLLIISLIMLGLGSCENKQDIKPANGKISFAVAMNRQLSALKSTAQDSTGQDTIYYSSYQLLFSVETLFGEEVIHEKLIPLYPFGEGFISENVDIPTGEYFLTKFMVISPYGEVVYASPLTGSPRAYLVNQPLPIYFNVQPGETSYLYPEVLTAEGSTPSDFGYASFMIQVVSPVTWHVMVMSENSPNDGSNGPLHAELLVYAPDGWSYYFQLEGGVNSIELRKSETYEMVLYKAGYKEIRFYVSYEEIVASTVDQPYIIKLDEDVFSLSIQPGPEEGKDAYLSDIEPDQNFGNHLYFESSYLSDSVLAVMRTTRSLMYFDLNQLPKSAMIQSVILTLHYDIPIPWEPDSLRNWMDKKCNCLWGGAALQQVIEPWEESEVTWNTQPQTTDMNLVMIYPFINNANFIDVDVTTLFNNASASPLGNFGFMMKLFPDENFPGFRFVSSDYPEEYMRPMLTVYYTLPD